MPVEKPAPPRPRRFDFLTSSVMVAGVMVSARRKPSQPPRCVYVASLCEFVTPKFLVTILMPLESCQAICALPFGFRGHGLRRRGGRRRRFLALEVAFLEVVERLVD